MKRPLVEKRLEAIDGVIKGLQARKVAYIERLQANCKHPKEHRVESGFVEGIIIDLLPHRTCLDCGYTEEGWSFRKLEGYGDITRVDYDTLFHTHKLGDISRREGS